MKTTIRVSCVDQALKIVDRPLLASGGLNEATVAFDFCAKWNGFAKTGVFYREEDEVYYSILDDDDICIIPWEVYSTPGYFYFTVFGDKGDVRRTANTLKYKAQKGLAGSDMLPSDPTPEVYDQIMGRLSEIEQGTGGGGGGGTGENGGYYRPKVSQPNENTMRVSFTASKAGMPSVAAQDITLPAGKGYTLTPADKQEIAEQAAEMVEVPEGGTVTDEQIAEALENYLKDNPITSGASIFYSSLSFEYNAGAMLHFFQCDKQEIRKNGRAVQVGDLIIFGNLSLGIVEKVTDIYVSGSLYASLKGEPGSGGGLTITDDSNGNVTIESADAVTITDDGNGNVTIV